jgi:quercetin dioxygenase-like cupin family protein
MIVKNFLNSDYELKSCHSGEGIVRNGLIFDTDEFKSKMRFIRYMEMPKGTSIGYHEHKNNEEFFVILEGSGIMIVNDEEREVNKGDIIVNKPYDSHGLLNNSDEIMKLLVFEVEI